VTDIRELMAEMVDGTPPRPEITDQVIAEGRRARHRRRLAQWGAGIGSAVVIAAVAVPIVQENSHGSSAQHDSIGSTGPPAPSSAPRSTPPCSPNPGVRCTKYGEIDPLNGATLNPDQRHLTVTFNGLCNTDHRAGVRQTTQRITIAVYGPRPFENLCDAIDTLTVTLTSPLSGRPVFDAYDESQIRVNGTS
jgi:hypothetical protein